MEYVTQYHGKLITANDLDLITELISKHPHTSRTLYYLETFVDTERFAGTCYKAANWRYLGQTTGRGKNDQTHQQHYSLKAVWGYPLVPNFRELLQR